jgi:hypothetical protein
MKLLIITFFISILTGHQSFALGDPHFLPAPPEEQIPHQEEIDQAFPDDNEPEVEDYLPDQSPKKEALQDRPPKTEYRYDVPP